MCIYIYIHTYIHTYMLSFTGIKQQQYLMKPLQLSLARDGGRVLLRQALGPLGGHWMAAGYPHGFVKLHIVG